MALIGTISGSVGAGGALTSATAITGTLVVANTSTDFPVLASDAIFFVSGAMGAIAASLPGVSVFGGDLRVSGSSYFTDIDVTGHGAVVVQPYGTSAGQTGEVRFKELAANGGNYTALKAADSIAANLSITLPNADGSNGNVLQTNGSGVTSFVDVNGLVTGSLSLVTINASSNITASNILANGDLAVNGGDITTTAATFNLVTGSATTVNFARSATSVVAGASGGSITFQGNITGSNALVSGDLAVDGGDITTAAATFNLITGSATTVNFAGAATALTMGANGTGATTIRNVITASAGRIALTNAAGSSISFPVGAGALGPPTFTNSSVGSRLLLYPSVGASSADWAIGMESQAMWFGVNVATTTPRFKWYAGTTEIASLRGDGLFTVTGSLATSTGNIIGAPGTGNNVMTLISSGNLLAKMDANNDGVGHKFAVLDYRDIEQFTVFEEGNAALSGSLVVSGSSIQTVTTTTYNLLTTALTGTLNIGTLANAIIVGGTTTTSSFTGATQVDGRSTLSSVTEKLVPSVGGTGTVAYDLAGASIFYVNGPTGAITANFTNVPTTPNRIITPTVIISQSATPRIVSAVQIDTAAQTINWANGTTPTGTANKQDVFGFSLIRSGSTWKVLGQMSTYG